MLQQLLVVAALAGLAVAAGEFSNPLSNCACGSDIQTYTLQTTAYCPSTAYPQCDVTKMVENDCTISCPGARGQLVYRNNSATWQATSWISCGTDGVLRNGDGNKLVNPALMRPNCAYKNPCDACPLYEEKTKCPAGYTCKSPLIRSVASDGCSRVTCSAGAIQIYENGVSSNNKLDQLYCTIANKWSNFSYDGAANGALVSTTNFTVNCILAVGVENCATPTMATALSQLPTTFRTGYSIKNAIYTKQAGVASKVTCSTGSTLYGFNGVATNVTGLEYTNRGWMECAANSQWTNGQYAYTPQAMVAACLKKEYVCAGQFVEQTCNQCDFSLVTKKEAVAPDTCNLGCPLGYRMIVANFGINFRVQNFTLTNIPEYGTLWIGFVWFDGQVIVFPPDEAAAVSCEPMPFPNDFSWPIQGMDCGYMVCKNELLSYSDGALKCTDPATKLVVSSSPSFLLNPFAMTSLTWDRYLWRGVDSTGAARSFKKDVFITCYAGIVPPPVVTPACGCSYNIQPSLNKNLVTKIPSASGQSCALGCASGFRMIIARGENGTYNRVEDFTCSNNNWRGATLLAGFESTFTPAEAFVTCEYDDLSEPKRLGWPIVGMGCDMGTCMNWILKYTNAALVCSDNTTKLVVSNARDKLENSFALVNLTWTGTQWKGVDLFNSEVRTFPQSVYMTCYKGDVSTPPSATTTVPTTPNACGAYDDYAIEVVCEDGQNKIVCPNNELITIITADKWVRYERMSFITGKGWMSFNCDGSAQLWKTTDTDKIVGIACGDNGW